MIASARRLSANFSGCANLRAFAVSTLILLGSYAGSAHAQGAKPQVWTTNVVPGEFPAQAAALAAVRAQGGVYALADKVEKVVQTETQTSYVYGASPRGTDVGPWYKYTLQGCSTNPKATEQEAIDCAAADSPSSPQCSSTSYALKVDWYDWQNYYDGTSKIETAFFEKISYSYQQVNSTWTCVVGKQDMQAWRERVVACPTGLDWSSAEKACVKHDIARISTKPSCACDGQHNPVSVSTGDKYQTESDFVLPWLSFSRTYHSAYSAPEGQLGPGWTHDFNVKLYLNSSVGAGVLMPHGEVLPFKYLAGSYETTDGSGRRLRLVSSVYRMDEQGRTLKFDGPGYRLGKIEHLIGDGIALQYDASGRLSTVTHSTGRSIIFEYDANPYPANSRLIAIKLDGAALVSYEYDAAGHLEYARYPSGTARRYHYEDPTYPSHLTGISDEDNSRFATYGYNTDGLATLSEHAGGLYHGTFDYQSDGSTVYTDANGRAQTFAFTTEGAYRKVTGSTDAAGTESTTYALTSSDFRRRPVSRLDKRGVQTTYSYADVSDPALGSVRRTTTNEAVGTPQARTTQVWRELNSTRVLKKTEPGRETIYQRNSRGQVVTQTVNEL